MITQVPSDDLEKMKEDMSNVIAEPTFEYDEPTQTLVTRVVGEDVDMATICTSLEESKIEFSVLASTLDDVFLKLAASESDITIYW